MVLVKSKSKSITKQKQKASLIVDTLQSFFEFYEFHKKCQFVVFRNLYFTLNHNNNKY